MRMSGSVHRLSDRDVCRALESLDAVELVARELIGADLGTGVGTGAGGLRRTKNVDGDTILHEAGTDALCVLPTESVRRVRTAAVTALAVRALQAPGVLTAALIGSAAAVRMQLAVIGRRVRDIGHVAVCVPRADQASLVEPSMRAALERSGTVLTETTDPRRAASGANVLVVAGVAADRFELGRPRQGQLVVHATDGELPDAVLDAVDQVYVDDLALLAGNRDRKVVRAHLDDAPVRSASYEGWHRHDHRWRTQRRIEAGLRQVLTAQHPGRTHGDDILLVELLGAAAANRKSGSGIGTGISSGISTGLAAGLRQAAIEQGLGTQQTSKSRPKFEQ
ncbi:hypothetical protein [Labedaea rhizosphaerae]|uniref:Ornithine cyclodeaminase/mu-crystallin family protein n=1 Tax=Labedaea rhizosphaerae TaxID=598644 RepID=A0A4R6SG09_LABRH|nr:hypothetical protein [Labedaea rhizosphaerae]TDQ00467.1 ornithine cyclodeaminase/mu-crystallin family protein [Labedaea rhizosphaerae]